MFIHRNQQRTHVFDKIFLCWQRKVLVCESKIPEWEQRKFQRDEDGSDTMTGHRWSGSSVDLASHRGPGLSQDFKETLGSACGRGFRGTFVLLFPQFCLF